MLLKYNGEWDFEFLVLGFISVSLLCINVLHTKNTPQKPEQLKK